MSATPNTVGTLRLYILADNGQCVCEAHLERWGVRGGRDSRGQRPMLLTEEGVAYMSRALGGKVPACETCGSVAVFPVKVAALTPDPERYAPAALAPPVKSEAVRIMDSILDHVCGRALYAQLVSRWADEREYEDIGDYQRKIESTPGALPPGCKIHGMLRRPFGFRLTVPGIDTGMVEVKFLLSGRVTVTKVRG